MEPTKRKRRKVLWGMAWCMSLAVVAPAGCLGNGMRCDEVTKGFRQSLLFSPEGREFSHPSIAFGKRFDEASEEERSLLVEQLIDIVKGQSGGYSRVVAAKTLKWLSYAHDGKYLSHRVAEVIARQIIRIADPVCGHVIPSMLTHETIGPPYDELVHLSRPYFNLIHVRCVVRVDSHTIILAEGLPDRNWLWRNPRGLLDGKPIKVHPFSKPIENSPPIASASILPNLSEENLYGEHTITSKVTVSAPNGSEFELERTLNLKVMKREEYFSSVFTPGIGGKRRSLEFCGPET